MQIVTDSSGSVSDEILHEMFCVLGLQAGRTMKTVDDFQKSDCCGCCGYCGSLSPWRCGCAQERYEEYLETLRKSRRK